MPVVAVDVAPIRAEPSEDAEQVTQGLRGEPLTVDEQREGWLRVRTAYEYPGWIRKDAVADGDPGSWIGGTSAGHVDAARSFLGAPYEWGGMSERGIDCSGLVHMAYRRTGRLVPRDAHEQEEAGVAVRGDELRPGDLVTYGDEDRADHVAIWLGNGRILHSTLRDGASGPGVIEEQEPPELRKRRRALIRL